MKTPREILIQRHAQVARKLDAIRCTVVGELNNQGTKEPSRPVNFVTLLFGCSQKLWRELVWPCRRIWTGLATVWMALAVFNLTHGEHNRIAVAKAEVPPAEIRMAFQEQRRLLTELVGQWPPASPAEPARGARKPAA